MDMTKLHEIEIALSPLPKAPRLPGWRAMLAAERCARAVKTLGDKLAAREAATLEIHSAATVKPARGRK